MEIKGRFVKKIFHNEENGYCVALFEVSNSLDEVVTTVGYINKIETNYLYQLDGDYVDHPKYGLQFKYESAQRIVGENNEDLIRYFSSEIFEGIGKAMAKRIVETLGLNAISMIKNDPDVLDNIEKMTSKRKQAILNGLQQEQQEDNVFLASHHLSNKAIYYLKKKYGDELMSVLLSNPYLPVREVDGIGFKTMDKFALSIGIDESDYNRLVAYCEYTLVQMCVQSGDSYMYYQDFYQEIDKYISKFNVDISTILDDLIADNRIKLEEDRVYHYTQYYAENYIASFINNFPSQPLKKLSQKEIETYLNVVQNNLNIVYQDKQREAIESFFKEDALIITGGPGTGKTTIVKAMMELSRLFYPQYVVSLVAPTGRAAKRLGELTNCHAKTIHSLLLWDKETGKFAKDENDPITTDILIIDEFSMVDQFLFYNLLKACSYLKKIVIIGDADQLPSVSIGNLLHDLISCDALTTIRLDRIYRQKEGSDIIKLAYDIKNDECEEIPVDNDVRFIESDNASARNIILKIVFKALENYDSIQEGFNNVQVLAPKHMGVNGINSLNVALQQQFNPKDKTKKEIQVGYRIFRENDKILQLKNQPDDDVFNGDIGIIKEIIYSNEDIQHQDRIIVDFDGVIVEYTKDNFENITHGYCTSVHKAQGSEYPIVIVPVLKEYGIMLQKRLIYTAITRAYRSLIFVGEKQAFYQGIKRVDFYQRKTTLQSKIEEGFKFQNE